MTIPHDFACPTWLAERLRVHGDRHGPHYQGFLSDHLPMALLTMRHGSRPTPTHIDDEHDAKLAFSLLDQARRLGSERFAEAAAVYGGYR